MQYNEYFLNRLSEARFTLTLKRILGSLPILSFSYFTIFFFFFFIILLKKSISIDFGSILNIALSTHYNDREA